MSLKQRRNYEGATQADNGTYVTPSAILSIYDEVHGLETGRYTKSIPLGVATSSTVPASDDDNATSVSKKLQARIRRFCSWTVDSRRCLQVFLKDGYYFALDHSTLRYYQTLEAQGRVSRVIVDVVPRKKIPKFLYELAFSYEELRQSDIDTGRSAADAASSEGSSDEDDRRNGGGEGGGDSDASSSARADDDRTPPPGTSNCSWSEPGADDVCLVCRQRFWSTKELTEHQMNKKHYGCATCYKSFKTMKDLQCHETMTQHGWDDTTLPTVYS